MNEEQKGVSKKVTVLVITAIANIIIVLVPTVADKVNAIVAILIALVAALIDAGAIAYLFVNLKQKKDANDVAVALLMAETAKLQAEAELLKANGGTK